MTTKNLYPIPIAVLLNWDFISDRERDTAIRLAGALAANGHRIYVHACRPGAGPTVEAHMAGVGIKHFEVSASGFDVNVCGIGYLITGQSGADAATTVPHRIVVTS